MVPSGTVVAAIVVAQNPVGATRKRVNAFVAIAVRRDR